MKRRASSSPRRRRVAYTRNDDREGVMPRLRHCATAATPGRFARRSHLHAPAWTSAATAERGATEYTASSKQRANRGQSDAPERSRGPTIGR